MQYLTNNVPPAMLRALSALPIVAAVVYVVVRLSAILPG